MKRKNNWNLFGVIALIAISAFMLIACPQNLATERPKTYKILTLDIGGQQQKLYYGSDNAWYKALSDEGLLLNENKVTGEDVKFNIPSAPTWTVTFKKNPISGMNDSEITISHESVEVQPELSLSDDSYIDKATGKVLASSISENITVTGTYPPKAIGQSVTAESTNPNYKFAGWTVNGEDINDIAIYEVSGPVLIYANWKNLSDFKVLTVKDGDVVKDTAYYNVKDGKWYKERSTTSEVITRVALPDSTIKTYTVTLKYNDGSEDGTSTLNSTFSGYGLSGTDSANIPASGELANYTIENDIELVSKWNEVKFTKPENPTRDGYVFDKWTSNDTEYIFDNVVTGAITLTANWTQKTYKTLTLEIEEQQQKLYYGSDSAWYSALSEGDLLLNENKVTGDEVKFNIPERVWTVTFNKNTPAGANDSEITITPASVDVTPELTLTPGDLIDNTGKVLASNISENITVTGTYPSKAIGKSVTAKSTNVNYDFDKWTTEGGEEIGDIDTYAVSGNITIKATWKNISDFKVLTVKDGDVVKDKAYYKTADGTWYNSNVTTSGEKTSVSTLTNRTYIITLNYDNGSPNGSGSVLTSFLGYGVGSEVKIQADGSLNGYTINKDTELVSLWSEVKFNEPSEQPTKDGYTFDAWYKDGQPYDFNSVVKGDITLTANWTKKTFNTLTFDITGLETPVATQTLYYGSDGAWYSTLSEGGLLLNANKVTGEGVKFNIPEAPTWTVALNKNTPTNENRPFSADEIILSHDQLTLYPKDGVFSTDQYISADGKVKVPSIAENVNVTLDTSRRRPSEIVEATTPDSIKLVGWLNGDEKISDLSQYEVTSDNISLNASWGYKVSIGELDVPKADIYDVDRGFYTTTQDIDESIDDTSKQQRVAYYAEGETVKLYYCKNSIRSIEITLKNEWSGETTLINEVGTYGPYNNYSLLEIPSMANQPLSISFNVIKSEVAN